MPLVNRQHVRREQCAVDFAEGAGSFPAGAIQWKDRIVGPVADVGEIDVRAA